MSTKTTFKRIALVAVAALGLGVLTSVAPATGAQSAVTGYVTSISTTTANAPVAGVNGTETIHTVYFKTSTTSTSVTVNPRAILTSVPAGSTMGAELTTATSTPTVASAWQMTTTATSTTLSSAASITVSAANAAVNGTYTYTAQSLRAKYDVAGTYVWTLFEDVDANGYVSGPDFSTTFTVVVSGSGVTALKATAVATNATSSVSGTVNGSLVKITLTDAAGNPANVDAGGGIKITMSGSAKVSKVNNTDVTDAATYTLGQDAFNGSGNAWVNVVDATAETVTLTLSGVGNQASTFTAPAATALVFKTTCTTSCASTFIAGTSTTNTLTEVAYATAGASATAYFSTGYATAVTTANAGIIVTVTDTDGKITGKALSKYDIVVGGSATATAPDIGAFSITSAFTAAGQTYVVDPGSSTGVAEGGTAGTVTATAAAIDSITATSTMNAAASYRSATGAKQSFTVTALDQFGGGLLNQTITPSITGRNSTLVLATFVTDADGEATWSYTDASTSTTSLTDTISFSSGGVTVTTAPVVTYTAAANFGASTVSLVTPSETTAGTINSPAVYSNVGLSALGDGVQAGVVTVTATVKDANAVVLAGVPVTFTISGTTAAVLSTKVTVITGSTGTAASSVYAWASGTYTVTATVGTVSDTATSMWRNVSPTSARVLSATASGNAVTAKVVDRLGNPVQGVSLKATRVGTGSFSGASTATGETGYDGLVSFILSGGTADVTVTTSTDGYGQTLSIAGSSGLTAATAYTATTAGTATTAEVGVGASFAPAGVGSVTVTNVADTAVLDTAQAATDAAAEATDAA